MRAYPDRLTFFAAVAIGAVACGGATSSSESLEAGGGQDATAEASSGGSDGGASSSGDDGSGGDDGSYIIMGGSSSGGSSGAGMPDAMASSGGALTDGGRDQIQCGAMGPCDSATQVCCATRTGRTCVTVGSCTGDSIACSGSNSCPAGSGDVCCEGLAANGTVRTRCATACPAGSPQLCTTAADCKDGDACRRGPDGYAVCIVVRDGGRATDAAGD